jgi:hypothetical protein
MQAPVQRAGDAGIPFEPENAQIGPRGHHCRERRRASVVDHDHVMRFSVVRERCQRGLDRPVGVVGWDKDSHAGCGRVKHHHGTHDGALG